MPRRPTVGGFTADVLSPEVPYGDSSVTSPLRALIFDLDGTLMEYAAAQDLDLAVCTNKAGVLAAAVLDGLGLTRYFRHLVYGDSLPHRKPHPEPIEWIIGQLGVPPEACVMIGDTENDARAARNSGVRSVFVSFGYTRLESLASQPDWVIHDFAQLDPILHTFGRQ